MNKDHTKTRGLIVTLTVALLTIFLPGAATADICGEQASQDYQAAVTTGDFERFIQAYQPCELAFVAVQRLAAPALLAHDWQGATAVFQQYQQSFPDSGERFTKIINVLQAPDETILAANLGSTLNTSATEFRPVLSMDGKTLFFTRNRGAAAGGEDIYAAKRHHPDWGRPKNIGPPISTDDHEMAVAIAADSSTMVMFGNYPGSYGRGDLFYAEQEDGCWSAVKHYPAPINSEYFDTDAMLTADNRAMLLVSDRPGGIGAFHQKGDFYHGAQSGNTDIYVYAEKGDGSYEFINLGDTINTPYGEYSPFLHPDGKTLYFSSEGHYGLGGLDVFKATRLSSTSWTEWSEPINLGKQINTPFNDWGYQIATHGGQAFFATGDRHDGFGASDIYMVDLPMGVRPGPVVAVSGRVMDPDGKPLAAKIQWNNLTEGLAVGNGLTNQQTGEYYIALPAGSRYSYTAEKEGYMGQSETLDFSGITQYTEYRHDIVLYPVGQLVREQMPLRLNNVLFDFDKYDLRPASTIELDRWAALLRQHPAMRAEIQGHTDSIGTDRYNQTLSERRAGAVVNYLRTQGIEPQRVTWRGFGEQRPLVDNTTSANRQLNRRVEIILAE